MEKGLPTSPLPTTAKLCTPNEIATALQVSIKTIYHWVMKNEIPYIKVGRHLRFDLPSVIDHFQIKTEASKPACFQNSGLLKPKLTKPSSLTNCGTAHLAVQRKD